MDRGEIPLHGGKLSSDELPPWNRSLVAPGVAHFLPEACVDPRGLVEALAKSLRHRAVDIVTGSTVVAVETADRHVTGVRTEKSHYSASVAINCAGAWSTSIPPVPLRTHPVKGQMLSVVPAPGSPHFPLNHVVRSGSCYLIPRTDGKIVIGATVEDAGFDKRVDRTVIQGLHQKAAICSRIRPGRILEAWAGLASGHA